MEEGERTKEPILLATGPKGVVRATYSSHDAWQVTSHSLPQRVTCLASHPRAASTVYLGTDGGGVVRSRDAGQTWQPAGLEGHLIRSLAVSPHAVNTVYAGTKPTGIFVTHDGGESWQELTGFRASRRWYWYSPAEPGDLRAYVQSICVSPTDPDVLLAGMEAGAVVLSKDGGETWLGHRHHADRDCHTLKFHDSFGDWVYQAGGGGPAVSRDGGHTWRHHDLGLGGRYCWACAADPARPEVWYVSAAPLVKLPQFWRVPTAHHPGHAHASIFRSSGGAGWQRLAGGLPQPLDHMVYGLVTVASAPGHVYAGLANGAVWHSADHGDNWKELPVNLAGGLRTLAIVASSPYSVNDTDGTLL